MMLRPRYYAPLALALCFAGCGSATPQEQLESIKANCAAVTAARTAKDFKAAQKQMTAAEKTFTALQSAAVKDPTLKPLADQADALLIPARIEFEYAEEEHLVRETLGSFKAKAYRATRVVAIRSVCESLALACDYSSRPPATAPSTAPSKFSELSAHADEGIRLSAELAVIFDHALTSRPLLPDGKPDYPAIAANMRVLGASPPPELTLLLALGFTITGRDEYALIEIESLDPAILAKPELVTGHGILRGIILRIHNCDRLAIDQIEKIAPGESAEGKSLGPDKQAFFHLILAILHAADKKYDKADLEIVRASRVWPNNPVTVFITGERLLAAGQREQAADSLEKQAAAIGDPTWAKLLAERARQVRDEKGTPRPLFTDTSLRNAIILQTAETLAKEKGGQAVYDTLLAAKGFTSRMLPTGANPATTAPAP